MSTIIEGSRGHRLRIDSGFFDYLRRTGIKLPAELSSAVRKEPQTDLLISLGGDGTFLRSAKLIAGTSATILGINTGRLGFLTGTCPNELKQMWDDIIEGRYETELRSMLEISTEADGVIKRLPPVLNEVAILKRDTASMIGVHTSVDGERVATFEGDGLLIATPTGSTAYSLSVGGPIIHPYCPTLLLAPIAPHTLNMRPIVIPDNVVLEMSVTTRNDAILLSSDGYSTPLPGSAKIKVWRSEKEVRIVRHPIHTFYDTLRNKLMWGQDVRGMNNEQNRHCPNF
ncbi:NAD(+)/NADH kinase [Porphyromonas sp.]|uniref:NAD(+)/NADH kinase n=1 Tax=Porphyromonas sp. TaxID=1924944 RepID=UPI0026DB12D1|nr:NAD(+)/NADH kinase [Porphyromonas sp.]MDO4695557.1 NAD(+)/NADH kinase [Porphyromonas sp.]MDO4770513.1 NAD(+)/NADH kinase [Porphyromonas sp.]